MLDFNAGKYAVFVWPAYAVTAAMFVFLITLGLARARHWRREVARLERDAEMGDKIS